MPIDLNRAAALAEEAVEITRRGQYESPSGRTVDIAGAVQAAVAGSREHAPDEALASPAGGLAGTLDVSDESTLAAARRLVAAGRNVAALSFGSARNPGGGFLAGALAQEESLCRSSALYACLEHQPLYAYHRLRQDAFYSDRVIHAPGVPVFRDDDGVLLEEAWRVSFLSAPAVNARIVLERDPAAGEAIATAMHARAARVLAVAGAHGHDALVLGAWGCGVFGNDPAVVADAFVAALAGPFKGAFAEVTFAILGAGEQAEETRAIFRRRIAAG